MRLVCPTPSITLREVYIYDADGNRTQRKEYRGLSANTAAHEVVTWSFGPITGRQTGVATVTGQHTLSTADDHSTSTTYTTYTHDILGRLSGSLVSTKVSDADPTLSSVTYRYDAYGNLKEQRTSDGITARRIYGYDHSGISVNLQPFGETAEEKFHHISAWERDKLVRLDYIRISATDYALLVESSSEEESTSPISAVANTPGELLWRQDIDYTPTGQKRTAVETSATATGFSSRRVDWAYDELDRLISEHVDSPGTASDYQTRYTLDMVGNRLSEVKIDGGGSSPTTVETTHNYRASATGYVDILTGTGSLSSGSWKSAAGASQQLVEEVAFGAAAHHERRRGQAI